MAENCFCYLNECFPCIFAKLRHDQNSYETLHDSKALPIATFVWAIFSTSICDELCISKWLSNYYFFFVIK